MSVNGTSPSAIRPCDGREGSTDAHNQRCEAKKLEPVCVIESRRALRPASSQLVTLLPSKVEVELASAVADRSVASWPAALSAIAVADDLSKSPVCL